MPIIRRNAVVPYTPSEMFQLVDNVERYSEFVPWCVASDVHSRDEDEVRATLSFARGGMQKSFTTCNRLQQDKMIEIRLVNGPFRHLEGFWRFDKVNSSESEIILDLEFEFSSRLLALAFGPVFHQVANMLVDVFCKRADEVYGEESSNAD